MNLFQRKPNALSDEERRILDEAKARIKAEQEKMEREKRLYMILVEDPLDFDTLARIGKRVGSEMLEVTNKQGSIVRYYFKANRIETTTVEEEKLTQEGVW
jgi:hypothetical protein